MFNLMPASYYSMEGSVNWLHVFAQLVIQVGTHLSTLLYCLIASIRLLTSPSRNLA